ncbi:hypothetical protein M153_9688000863 [Pseudoloma neurophilia]|uniref:Non-structural maintenance of chromosomes element 4 n=1 Tax=Pseudoloma neurophilia TaxID=146866 RepID=A0A0R0M1K1_9MICR|nr:hypothetical protein M153_9688000863 [Pseudoloma neurophilia]
MSRLQEKYFEILNNIRTEKGELKDFDREKIDSFWDEANLLFSDIKNPIELKLDARISAEAVNLSSVDFEKKLRNRKITTQRFIEQLNRALIQDSDQKNTNIRKIDMFFNEMRKNYYGIKFHEFMSIGEPRRINRISGTRKKDEKNFEQTQVDKGEMKEDTFLIKINKIVEKIGIQTIDYYKIVLDPTSFTKTIENIFALSFAIKLKKLSLIFDENGNISLTKRFIEITTDDRAEKEDVHLRHFASTIDYKEYLRLLEILNIKEAFLKL